MNKNSKRKCKCCGKAFVPNNSQKVYCSECSSPIVATCKECGKIFELSRSQIDRYRRNKGNCNFYCSAKCSNGGLHYCNICKEVTYHDHTHGCMKHNNPFIKEEVKEKIKQTNLKRLGVKNPGQSEKCMKKARQTTQKHFGTDFAIQNKEVLKKSQQRYKERTGYKNPGQNPEVKEKMRQTNLKKRGVKYALQDPKVRALGLKNYKKRTGYDNPSQNPKVKEKIKQTNLKKRGVEYSSQDPKVKEKVKETNIKLFGTEYPYQNKKIMNNVFQKIVKTKENNNGISKNEKYMRNKLKQLSLIHNQDFFTEYYSGQYQFHCDFYFPKRQLYAELNIYWSHGTHFFESDSKEDQQKLKKWKEKAKQSKHYKNAIDVWTIRDPLKRETARKNNLNYVTLWSQKDIDEWFKLGMPNGKDWDHEYSWRN